MSKQHPSANHVPGIVLTVLASSVSLIVLGLLIRSDLVPLFQLSLIAVILLSVTALSGLLVWNSSKKLWFIPGCILAVLEILLLGSGSFFLARGIGALDSITGPSVETTHIGIYVRADDPAQSLTQAADYTFGIPQASPSMTHALQQLEDDLGSPPKTFLAEGGNALVDLLLSGQLNAILIQDSYLDILEESQGYEGLHSQLRELTVISVETEVEPPKQVAADESFTVLISGIDTRGSLTAKSRCDVNILATVNPRTHEILLVSTPRDYFVPLSISNGVPDKLTHAGIYGIDVSMDTIGMLYDIDVDYYFRVNFGGFKNIIDSLGGVTVYSDYDFQSGAYSFRKGENFLDGEHALVFARERYAFPDGDRQRGRNQMAVIQGVVDKITSPDILRRFNSLMTAVEGSFETSVPYDLIASLVRSQLKTGGGWDISTYSVTGTDGSEIPYSMSSYAYVMYPDLSTVEEAKAMMARVRSGQ